jgi:hypothetical protein
MTIRTWAAWNKNRTLTYALPIFYIFVWVSGFTTVGIFLQSLRCQCSVLKFRSLGTYRTSYSILFSWSQSPHPVCWVPLDAKWSDYICLLGSSSPLRHRCGCNLPHDAIRNVLKDCAQWCWCWWLFQPWDSVSLLQRWFEFHHHFSEIIQIAPEVDRVFWKLYTETVSPIYLSSPFYLPITDSIGVLYYLCLFGKLIRMDWL